MGISTLTATRFKRTRSDILQGQALFRKVKNCLPEVFRQTDKGLSEIIEGEFVPPYGQPLKQNGQYLWICLVLDQNGQRAWQKILAAFN